MSDKPTPGTLAWADLTVPDAEKIRDFYAGVVRWGWGGPGGPEEYGPGLRLRRDQGSCRSRLRPLPGGRVGVLPPGLRLSPN